MKKVVLLFSFILMGVLILSACAQPFPAQAVTVTAEMPGSTVVGTPAGDEKTVTLAEQGKTITLAVGERFLLKLGEEYTWNVQVSDQAVVSRVKNIMVIRGAQGVYEALAAGTTTLTAAGDPQCRQSDPPCAMPSIQFNLSIDVK